VRASGREGDIGRGPPSACRIEHQVTGVGGHQ
jgi:hypothetical protein